MQTQHARGAVQRDLLPNIVIRFKVIECTPQLCNIGERLCSIGEREHVTRGVGTRREHRAESTHVLRDELADRDQTNRAKHCTEPLVATEEHTDDQPRD